MCGIVGISSHSPVVHELLDSLIHLQHRGQDSAGIITSDDKFYIKRGHGLVREVFTNNMIQTLKGNNGIAHVRYPTAGGRTEDMIQPFWTSFPYGIALAHNGNLTNYQELKTHLNHSCFHHLNTDSDSELLLYIFSHSLNAEKKQVNFFDSLCNAVNTLYAKSKGAYSVVSYIIGHGLCAFRDKHGIRSLVIGRRKNKSGPNDYIIASENTMFYHLGFEFYDDVQPGEVVYINTEGNLFRKRLLHEKFRPCLFEYIYFARPDAKLNDVSVYRARLRMGQNLARHWKKIHPDKKPDVVIPVPFSSNTAALAFANELGVRYTEGLYKNPFIGRTFIMPDKNKRRQSVRYKLSPQSTEIRNKIVLLLDDSIVRGVTSKEVVDMVREYGAKAVYFASASPIIKHPCFYGIDMPSEEELIGHDKDEQSIADFLGVDILLYQTMDDLNEAVTRKGKHAIDKPCMACFDKDYFCGKTQSLKPEEEHT